MPPRHTSVKERPINLALQGGGSHGALAWGVLDRLLEEPSLKINEISGTSAGAMNAVVLAAAYETDGREGARAALHDFWKTVSETARFSPLQKTPFEAYFSGFSMDNNPAFLMLENLSRMFSPYELNPLDLNPLRDVVAAKIDFDRLNGCRLIKVHVTATSVRTGLARTFSTGELSVDAVMASACLPQMFRAVEIGDEAYWDGGYTANPALFPLVGTEQDSDLLIVQLNPMRRDEIPRSARDIINRINEISFNTSLLKELRSLNLLQRLTAAGHADLPGEVRLHMIHCADDVQDLAASSKMNAEWGYLQTLFTRGRAWAQQWLDAHLDDVGKTASFDLEELFADPLAKVKVPKPAK